MEIEVKCPKCRFRFDTEVHRGATEITTACPRCGFPLPLRAEQVLLVSPPHREYD